MAVRLYGSWAILVDSMVRDLIVCWESVLSVGFLESENGEDHVRTWRTDEVRGFAVVVTDILAGVINCSGAT